MDLDTKVKLNKMNWVWMVNKRPRSSFCRPEWSLGSNDLKHWLKVLQSMVKSVFNKAITWNCNKENSIKNCNKNAIKNQYTSSIVPAWSWHNCVNNPIVLGSLIDCKIILKLIFWLFLISEGLNLSSSLAMVICCSRDGKSKFIPEK